MTAVLRDGSGPPRHSGAMKRCAIMFSALLAASPALASELTGPNIRDLLSAPQAAPPPHVNFAYVLEVDATYAEGEEAEQMATAVIEVDATKPPGERARVLSRNDETKDLTKIIDGVIEGLEEKDNTPERMAESFYCTLDAENFEIAHEDHVRAILKPDVESMEAVMRKDGTPKRMARRLSERLDGEIILSKLDGGRVVASNFRLTRPMKVMLIANIHSMELSQDCVPSPDGHQRSERLTMNTRVTALGKDMRTGMEMRVRDVVAVTPAANPAANP